jgi:hypothetical protein
MKADVLFFIFAAVALGERVEFSHSLLKAQTQCFSENIEA